jgi:ribose 5-phosphate isomerase RpiB
MTRNGQAPELSYIHTGFMSALLLDTRAVDFVIGGCGTGQGFLNSVMQYPGVVCGHITSPLDAWLFMQINSGNCVSLALNQGYGWAGNINMRFIFEKLFSVKPGCGYPSHRSLPQKESRSLLEHVGAAAHRNMKDIIVHLPDEVVLPVAGYPGFLDILSYDQQFCCELLGALRERQARK